MSYEQGDHQDVLGFNNLRETLQPLDEWEFGSQRKTLGRYSSDNSPRNLAGQELFPEGNSVFQTFSQDTDFHQYSQNGAGLHENQGQTYWQGHHGCWETNGGGYEVAAKQNGPKSLGLTVNVCEANSEIETKRAAQKRKKSATFIATPRTRANSNNELPRKKFDQSKKDIKKERERERRAILRKLFERLSYELCINDKDTEKGYIDQRKVLDAAIELLSIPSSAGACSQRGKDTDPMQTKRTKPKRDLLLETLQEPMQSPIDPLPFTRRMSFAQTICMSPQLLNVKSVFTPTDPGEAFEFFEAFQALDSPKNTDERKGRKHSLTFDLFYHPTTASTTANENVSGRFDFDPLIPSTPRVTSTNKSCSSKLRKPQALEEKLGPSSPDWDVIHPSLAQSVFPTATSSRRSFLRMGTSGSGTRKSSLFGNTVSLPPKGARNPDPTKPDIQTVSPAPREPILTFHELY